jgi:hypothetical protein
MSPLTFSKAELKVQDKSLHFKSTFQIVARLFDMKNATTCSDTLQLPVSSRYRKLTH